ncbi:MAG: bifunctional DNA-formamidopyrimidine glycosylase/DNA-(apurinic or apyrimidinic site) lyase [Candidatus Sungbacteria bacterium]|nr:bifunctional DNA-formamidopyrimidine glycosylase/DNA-(apurinic or apyrimidinic site) lyase [Candidatus Sungbacteria bacterium]
MPELPEVETIVRYLRPRICGRRILSMESGTMRLFRGSHHQRITNPKRIYKHTKRTVIGKEIKNVKRFGKNIALVLSSGDNLLIHLMMTGQILLNPKDKKPHDRMEMRLSGGTRLIFNDTRKFGRVRLVKNPQSLVGSDPLRIRFNDFNKLVSSRTGALKSVLLNQQVLSGIGNIYADEALWSAGIHPLRKASDLSATELKGLYRACRSVLNTAIKKEGTTFRDYRKPDDSEGGYYAIRKVYQRTGERCSRDGAIIKRIVIGQRATHYCPKHQV